MFERLQKTVRKNQRELRKMAEQRLPMRRRHSGPFSARWLMIMAAVAVPVALLVRRLRQGADESARMDRLPGMVPATGSYSPVRELERTHFEEVGKDVTVTEIGSQGMPAQAEPSVTQSRPAAPPMASEDSPVEVSGPAGLRKAEIEKAQGIEPASTVGEPDRMQNDYLPEGQSTTVRPGDITAPDRMVEQQTPPESGETTLDDFRVIEGIGPGITMILHRSGIATYQQLADTPVERLHELMKEANISQITDPTTWPEQAKLAAQGDWKGLDDMQSHLRAGRRVE